MLTCPHCDKSLRPWTPLLTGGKQTVYCPHCGKPVRLARGRSALLTGLCIAAIASTTTVQTAHPYLLTACVSVACALLFVVFAKFVRLEDGDASR